MSVRGFNTGSGVEQYDYEYLDNKPEIPTKKSDIGLGNVDNTSDLDKPISNATQEALNQKVPITRKVNNKELSTDITLTSGDIGYNASTAYDTGTVGKELSELNRQLSDVEENQISELRSAIDYNAIDSMGVLIKDKYIDSSDEGKEKTYANWSATRYIPVTPGQRIYVKTSRQSQYNMYYDVNKDYISGAIWAYVGENWYTVPDGAAFVRYSNTTAAMEDAIIRLYPETDKTLSVAGMSADAKATGESIKRADGTVLQSDLVAGYIDTTTTPVSLTPVSATNIKCYVCDCSPGQLFTITGTAGTTALLFAFLNSSNEIIVSASTTQGSSVYNLIVEAPENTAKAVFNFQTAYTYNLYFGMSNDYKIWRVSAKEKALNNKIDAYHSTGSLIDLKNLIDGFILNNVGTISTSSTYKTTDYIFVEKGQTVVFTPKIRKLLVYKDVGYPALNEYYNINTNSVYQYTATADCYVRATIYTSDISSVCAYYGVKGVPNAVIDPCNLLDFATISNRYNCSFSMTNGVLTVETQDEKSWSCINFVLDNITADDMYLFKAKIDTITGNPCFRMIFYDASSSYGGTRTDTPVTTSEYSVFSVARSGCLGVRLFITGATAATGKLVFSNIALQKVFDIKCPDKKKRTKFNIPHPRVSFIDDDGRVEFYQYLLPMIRSYHVPIATAYQSDNGFEFPDQFMTREQLQEVEAAGGEVIEHGGTSLVSLGDDAEANVVLAKRLLNANGFYPTVYVYPSGQNNETVRCMVAKYFDAAFKVAQPFPPGLRTESGCVPEFRLNRCHCGGEAYDDIVTTGIYANLDTASMEYFETLIQECITNKSWLVLYTHAWQMADGQAPTEAANQFDLMEDIIERILELKAGGTDIDIIKVEDGFEMFGNAYQAGDYLGQDNEDMTLHSSKGCAISKTGLYDFPVDNNVTPST